MKVFAESGLKDLRHHLLTCPCRSKMYVFFSVGTFLSGKLSSGIVKEMALGMKKHSRIRKP